MEGLKHGVCMGWDQMFTHRMCLVGDVRLYGLIIFFCTVLFSKCVIPFYARDGERSTELSC